MKTVMDSVNEITPELLHRNRNRRAVNGRAVATSASAMRESVVVLRLTSYRDGATPVHGFTQTAGPLEPEPAPERRASEQ